MSSSLNIKLILSSVILLWSLGCCGAQLTVQQTLDSATPIPPDSKHFPLAVLGSNGRLVTFDKPPVRIVAMDSAAVETLFSIGQGHRLVGTHDFVSYPPEATGIPKVGDAFNMNIEAIVNLDPDLVFVFSDGFVDELERAAIKVLYIESLKDDFRKVADNVRLWGKITGALNDSERIAYDFESRVAAIEEIMANRGQGPVVFQDEGDLWTPGNHTLMSKVFVLLKLRNIANDVSGYVQFSPEVIVERNPEIIIASYGDKMSENPAFKYLSAVRSGRVYVPDSDSLSVAGPRYIDAIESLAKWVYPDLFPAEPR